LIRKNTPLLLIAAVLVSASVAGAQDQSQPSAFQKQLSRITFDINATALLNQTVSGAVDPKGGNAPDQGQIVSDKQSNTVGALGTIRYIKSPYVGLEFNFLYSRYTENFSYPPPAPFGVQTQGDEISFGYVVTPPIDLFGLQPYASVGAGTTDFKPTAGGGQSLPHQGRMTYYYSFGVQKDLLSNFGVRAGFRQSFFLAPDFGQNYLTILQHTTSYQPNFGFYVRF
jgi:opacity protein-like surface antigen